MVDSLSYFHSSQCSMTDVAKYCGIYYPVCGMVGIKDPLQLIEKNSSYNAGNRFHL